MGLDSAGNVVINGTTGMVMGSIDLMKGAAGKTLVGYDSSDTDFNTIGKTGGEKEHTLTKSELPKIDITTKYANPSTTSYGTGLQHGTYAGSSANDLVSNINFGGKAHNNLQPFEVVSFWKRTS